MLSDLKFPLRSLAKVPAYTAIIIITLAVGIGANSAIFSFFNGILLESLPYDAAERVTILKKAPQNYDDPVGAETGIYAADFRELAPQLRAFSAVGTYTLDSATVTGSGPASLVSAAVVTSNFFQVVGSSATLGRVFSTADASAGAGRLAVVSHDYWQSHFGGSFDVVGRTITTNGVIFTIVGVLAPDFDFPREAQLWVTPATDVPEAAIGQAPMDFSGRGNNLRTFVGRLAPGVSVPQAEDELRRVLASLPNPNQVERASFLVSLRDHSVGDVR